MGFKFETIICSTDFSKHSEKTLEQGVELSKIFGARLLIFHSIPIVHDQFYGGSAFRDAGVRDKLRFKALTRIKELASGFTVNWTPVITFGEPVEELARVVEDRDVDLVVAASYGVSGLKRMLSGTVVERMARIINVPLFVVENVKKPQENTSLKQISRILVGCDASPGSLPLLKFSNTLAERFGAELLLLHAVQSPAAGGMDEFSYTSYGEAQKEYTNHLRDNLSEMFSSSISGTAAPGIFIEPGLPEEALVSCAEKEQCDILIVGVKQHGPLEKFLIGSTTESVLRRSRRPVIVFPSRLPDGKQSAR